MDRNDLSTAEYIRHQRTELDALKARLHESMALLKQAGDALEIQGNQKHRALRFRILNFVRFQDGH